MEKQTYSDGTEYVGGLNEKGQKSGFGYVKFGSGAQYAGDIKNGLFNGHGVLLDDGSKYEGQFVDGLFHGVGVFRGKNGMIYEGEFSNGEMKGLGRVTFIDGTYGLPQHEGLFADKVFQDRLKCFDTIKRAIEAAEKARSKNS